MRKPKCGWCGQPIADMRTAVKENGKSYHGKAMPNRSGTRESCYGEKKRIEASENKSESPSQWPYDNFLAAWACVMIEDMLHRGRGQEATKRRKDAEEWVFSASDASGSFRWILRHFDIDPERALTRLRTLQGEADGILQKTISEPRVHIISPR